MASISKKTKAHRSHRSSFLLLGLAVAFTALMFVQLALLDARVSTRLTEPSVGGLAWRLASPLVLALCLGLAHLFLARRFARFDPLLLPLTALLTGAGLGLTARLAPGFLPRQTIWVLAATGALLAVTLIPPDLGWLRRYKYAWLLAGLALLATTLVLGVNPSGFGPRLWLGLGGVFFQPSEPLKILLVSFIAAYLADRRRQMINITARLGRLDLPHPAYWGPLLSMWGFSIVLLLWQRDLGAAFLFFATFVAMLYAAIGQRRYVLAGVGLLLVAGLAGYRLFDHVAIRVDAWLNPWPDAAGRAYQIVQSLLAFASGGVFGQGLGQGLPTAIPVVHTDFVIAAIGEEYGLLGAAGVLACFALLVGRAFHIGLRARTGFEALLAAGLGVMLGLQSLVIAAGTLKVLPLTGVTLPFVSYGGSSLLTSFVMVGLLLFISTRPGRAAASDFYIRRVGQGFLLGFCLVGGALLYWQVLRAPALVAREDNPRPIIAEQRLRRGQLLTAGGIALAQSVRNEAGTFSRRYPYPSLAPVTGYYSQRYGVGGTEAAFDDLLRGAAGRQAADEWWDQLLHRPQVGRDVPLTIDLDVQVAADAALGRRSGAVVIIDVDSGAILAMTSHPTFDPNLLDESWDQLRQDPQAPLLNRATQGLFPVGGLARYLGLLGLSEAGAAIPPRPLQTSLERLLAPLGGAGFAATAGRLGLDSPPTATLPAEAGRLPDGLPGKAGELAVTPLHLARLMAALANDGLLPEPVLSPLQPSPPKTRAFSRQTAAYLRSLLEPQAEMAGWQAAASPEVTGNVPVGWYAGLAPAGAPRFAIAVVVALPEEANAGDTALGIARSAMSAAIR
ncbi:MAG: FtsW/RodA/SpoVE family cell cycle protein [Anaerolineae bacterium]